jgi:hypothetical protein
VKERCQREVFPILHVRDKVFERPEGHEVHGCENICRGGQAKEILVKAETPAGVKKGHQD